MVYFTFQAVLPSSDADSPDAPPISCIYQVERDSLGGANLQVFVANADEVSDMDALLQDRGFHSQISIQFLSIMRRQFAGKIPARMTTYEGQPVPPSRASGDAPRPSVIFPLPYDLQYIFEAMSKHELLSLHHALSDGI
jgi:hypothetical protein